MLDRVVFVRFWYGHWSCENCRVSTELHDGVKLIWAIRVRKPTHFRTFSCSLRSSMNPSGDMGWKQCPGSTWSEK